MPKDIITVIIETPAGSANKYAFKKKTNRYFLKKILPSGMVFPFHFGFFPGTKGGDGDPLDVLVLLEGDTWPGVELEVRIIGGFSATQSSEKNTNRNDRIIAVAAESAIYAELKNLEDLSDDLVNQIKNFFINYNKLEGKEFSVHDQLTVDQAFRLYKNSGKK